MPQEIRIAKNGAKFAPTLPVDAVTRTFGIFGVKDSGKTTTARTLVEGICATGGHVLVLDPVGVWWGATRAGEGPGIPGIVLGGEHGDVPLEATGGQLVADLAVSRSYQLVVVDLKLLRKGQAQKFMADFLEGVYFANRRPLHIVFEEADRALPQSPRGMDPTLGRVLGAAEDIVKLGRSRGLGSTFISQRFATVTKNVTEQVQALILHAQPGKNDREAVKGWMDGVGDAAQGKEVLSTIASLSQGEAWLYSPVWLKVLERIRVRKPRTLDSSSTPSDDERETENAAPRATVNLAELRSMMAETVERAAANDPKVLKARVAELEERLEKRPEPTPAEPVRVLVPDREATTQVIETAASLGAAANEVETRIAAAAEAAQDERDKMFELIAELREQVQALDALADAAAALPQAGAPREMQRDLRTPVGDGLAVKPLGHIPPAERAPARREGVTGPEQRVLDALAWWKAIGVEPVERGRLAFVAGYHERTKGFLNALGSLKSAGRVEYPRPGAVELTADGGALAESPAKTPTLHALHTMIYSQVGHGSVRQRVLAAVVAAHPNVLTRPVLAESLGYHERTKGLLNALGSLRSLGLIDYPQQGQVAATETMFPPALASGR